MNKVNNNDRPEIQGLSTTRRQLVAWSVPVVACVTLPAHAQTSVSTNCSTIVTPELVVTVAPKCSGNPPIAQATLELRLVGADDVIITDIVFTSPDANASLMGLPVFPATDAS